MWSEGPEFEQPKIRKKMKERMIVTGMVAALAAAVVLATRNTDVIYVAVTVFSFVVCIAYAEGCDRL
jgi:1,4-dihydroxy-2-naphthoate octaprenyltransferase